MPNNDDKPISSEEYKKVTEELYGRNLELARLYKQVDSLNHELGKANESLESLLKQRESLTHLITHKVKSSFTHSKYIFAEMLDGSFGEVAPQLKKLAEQGIESDNMGIQTVDLILNIANMQKGLIKFEMRNIDLKDMVLKNIFDKKGPAETKGLKMESDIKDGVYKVMGDAFWLKEVLNNLLDNSTKYTKEGVITVGLERRGDKILFYVKDTGVGINEEDKKNLFTEGGRGKESMKINVDSTGYGLYTVKLVIEAHKGKVWAESEGTGKGSTFFVELDAV